MKLVNLFNARRLKQLERKQLRHGILTDSEQSELFWLQNSPVCNKAESSKFLEKSTRFFHYFTLGFAIILLLLLSPILIPFRSSNASAYTNSFTSSDYYVSITAAQSVNIDLATMSNFATSYTSDSLFVASNVPSYDIYLSTTGNTNALYLNGDETDTVNNIPATSIVGANIQGMSTNSWGYSSDSGLTFNPVPVQGSEAKIFSYTGGSSGTTNNNEYEIRYGVKANRDKSNGVYSNTVLYSAVSDTSTSHGTAGITPAGVEQGQTYTIQTDLFTNMEIGNYTISMVNDVTGETLNCTNISDSIIDNLVNISCTIPSDAKSGYYNIIAYIPKFGREYQFSRYLVGNAFYAITYMQEMTSSICASVDTPSTSATIADTNGSHQGDISYYPETVLKDSRDNKTYIIRKLADGNCWMAQNLNLILNKSVALTNEDTDLNSKTTWTPARSTATTISNGETIDTVYSYQYPSKQQYCYGSTAGAAQTCSGTMTSSMSEHVGILYNWYTATAATGSKSGTSPSLTNTLDAADSICPKGWQLPDGAQSNDVNGNGNKYTLYNLIVSTYNIPSTQAGSATLRKAPFSYVMSGGYGMSNSLYNFSNVAWIMTSSASTSAGNMFSNRITLNDHSLASYAEGKNGARAVRCVAK